MYKQGLYRSATSYSTALVLRDGTGIVVIIKLMSSKLNRQICKNRWTLCWLLKLCNEANQYLVSGVCRESIPVGAQLQPSLLV